MSKNQAAAAVQTAEVIETESPNGSEQVRRAAPAGRPKNPVPGQETATQKPGRAKSPGPEMSPKMSKVMDAFMGGGKTKPAKPEPADALPPGVDDPEDAPELEDDAEPTSKKAREEIDDKETGAQKLAALRNRDNAKKAPKAKEDGAEGDDEAASVPENDEEPAETATEEGGEEAAPKKPTAAEQRALADYARRFGLNIPLDLAARARDSHLDQFAQIVDGQANGMPPGGQPAGPAAGGSQGGQPHQASGPPLTSPRNPGLGQQPVLDDKLITAIDDAIGGNPVFAPIGKIIQGLQAQVQEAHQALREVHSWRQEDLHERGLKLLNDFWVKKVNAGFNTQLGSMKQGITQVQHQVRLLIVQKASAYATAMRQQGNPVTPDEALELSFQHVFRDQQAAQQQQQGRQQVERQIVNRHRQQSLPGGPGQRNGGTSTTSQALDSALDSFIGANSRRR